jgi:hypothetical protein
MNGSTDRNERGEMPSIEPFALRSGRIITRLIDLGVLLAIFRSISSCGSDFLLKANGGEKDGSISGFQR